MNTNGSRPRTLARLFDAGLDSVRISLNSVRKPCYLAYFRPRGYRFEDVLEGIDLALDRNRFVAVNYLNLPGFTDTPQEAEALLQFLQQRPIGMIQWRNLNFDPQRYLQAMRQAAPQGRPMGMRRLLKRVRRRFPELMFGYFNPPRERFQRRFRAPSEVGTA